MAINSNLKNILDLDLLELKNFMRENGEKEFRGKQVLDFIYKGIFDFDLMTNLPKDTREKLKGTLSLHIPIIERKLSSKKGDTFKYLMRLSDNNVVECVTMKYDYGNSICISTQVGCRMGCKFCASTLDGVVRNLGPGEMLGQIIRAQEDLGERISNVVLMGSGEPMDNFDNVMKFISLVNAEYGLNIGQRHITLSTCGIVPKIIELADKKLQITLAVSLHAPNDVIRKTIMPIANKYSIKEVIQSLKYYVEKTGRRVSFEYSLIDGFNDKEEHALELSKLLKGLSCHVNIIPINEIKENTLKRPSLKKIQNFCNILKENNIESTIRKEMGTDIDAACGQLRRGFLKDENKVSGVN